MLTVLSLFDGMSGGMLCFSKLGIADVVTYHASEIDKHAIAEVTANFPDVLQYGDITGWRNWDIDWSGIDLILAGSPCQGFSQVGLGLAFNDPRSSLFFVFSEILDHVKLCNPEVHFLLENVVMQEAHSDVITSVLGVVPVTINSGDHWYCYRPRMYWASWEFSAPEPEPKPLASVVPDGFTNPAVIVGRRVDPVTEKRVDHRRDIAPEQCLEVMPHTTARCLTTVSKDSLLSHLPPGRYPGVYTHLTKDLHYREPTLKERCLFNGVPEDYFKVTSDSQAAKMIGNGWNIETVSHILAQCPVVATTMQWGQQCNSYQ